MFLRSSSSITSRHFRFAVAATLATALIAGCERSSKLRAPPEDVPPSITVTGGALTEGLWQDSRRQSVSIGAFSITTTPITVLQYKQCVGLGACSAPAVKVGTCADVSGVDGATFDAAGADTLPITCVSASQAKAYCDWVGGRLPRVTEWLLAARGPSVHPFAWGEDTPTCARVTRLRFLPQTQDDACCDAAGCEAATSTLGAVAQHAQGSSPIGLADVLITRAEIVGVEEGALASACRPPADGCVISGWRPGEIANWAPLPEDGSMNAVSPALAAAGFRCAWDGGSQ